MSSVRSWPTYLLYNVPDYVRDSISKEAWRENLSLAETVRRVLCDRYKLDCAPVTLRRGGAVGYDPGRDGLTSKNLLLRVPPDLFEAIKEDALRRVEERPRVTMKTLIMEALEDHYERTPA